MTVLIGAVAIVVYAFIAYCLGRLGIAALRLRADGLTRAGCPVLGAAAMAGQLWIYGLLHIPWWPLLLMAPWVVLVIALRSLVIAAVRADAVALANVLRRWRELDPLTGAIGGMTLVTLLYYLLNLAAQPLVAWDAIAMWLYKAKVFYGLGSVNLDGLPAWDRHLDYPPLVSLVADSFWVLLGRVDDDLGKTFGFVFLIAALWSAATLLLPMLGSRLGVLVLLILAAMPALQSSFANSGLMGYADFPIAALIMLSVAFVYRSGHLGRDQDSALAVVFAALAALTKNEGIPFLLVISAVVGAGLVRGLVHDRTWPEVRLVALVAVSLLSVIAWQVYVAVHGFSHDQVTLPHPSPSQLPARARTIVSFYLHLVNRQNDYAWLAAAWLVSMLVAIVSRAKRVLVVWLIVTAQIGFYGVALLLTPYDISWELGTSADRLVLQVTPVLVLLLGISVANLGLVDGRISGRFEDGAERTVGNGSKHLDLKTAIHEGA